MKTIAQFPYNGNLISVTETFDADYAHDCFDGTEREWTEIIEPIRAMGGNAAFYIVSCGLSGCYMADSVSVFTEKDSAISYAKDTLEFWKDEDADADSAETDGGQ